MVLCEQRATGALSQVKSVRSGLDREDRKALDETLQDKLIEAFADSYRVTVLGLWKLGQQPAPEGNVARDMIALCDAFLATGALVKGYRGDPSRAWTMEDLAEASAHHLKDVRDVMWFLKDLELGQWQPDDRQCPLWIQLNELALDASSVESILQHSRRLDAWNASHRLRDLTGTLREDTATRVLDYLTRAFPTTEWKPGAFYLEHSHFTQVDGLRHALEDVDDELFDGAEQKKEYRQALSAIVSAHDAWQRGITNIRLQGAQPTIDRNPVAVIHQLMTEILASTESPGAEEDESATTWSLDEQKLIRKSFYTSGAATCPNDGATLRIKEKKLVSGNAILIVSCPLCGRAARPYGTGPRARDWDVKSDVAGRSSHTVPRVADEAPKPHEYLPEFCSYLSTFFNSKFPSYFERRFECRRRSQPDDEAAIIEGLDTIVITMQEDFADLRIPNKYASPQALVGKVEEVADYLRRQRTELIEPRMSSAVDGYSYQLETLGELNAEVMHALTFALAMTEVSSYRRLVSSPPAVPRFRFLERVKSGLYGSIWKAVDSLDRSVAVKLISPSMAGHSSAMEHARALARSQHSNVVHVYFLERIKNPETGSDDDAIVMEWIDGETWRERCQRRMTAMEVSGLGTGVLDAIAHMHANGLVHGDLHNENIMVVAGRAKVIDPLYRASDTLALLSSTPRAERLRSEVRSVIDRLADALDAMEDPRGAEFRSRVPNASTLDEARIAFVSIVGEQARVEQRQSPVELMCTGRACVHEESGASCRRVRVTNTGRQTVRNVEIQLEEFSPRGATFLPVRLQRLHQLAHPFDLAPGAEVFVDVVSWNHGAGELHLCYDQALYPKLTTSIPLDDYTVSVVATGDDIAPSRNTFQVEVVDGVLAMHDNVP